mgnify:FL=1
MSMENQAAPDSRVINVRDSDSRTEIDTDPSLGRIADIHFPDTPDYTVRGMVRQGDDLLVQFGNNQQLALKGHYLGADHQFGKMSFQSYASWTYEMMTQRFGLSVEGAGPFHFTDAGETITGNDQNNALYGEGGDDVLRGGAGKDTLVGGAGADGYAFAPGDGQDIVDAYSAGAGRQDSIHISAPLSIVDKLTRQGDDLTLSYNQTDSITIKGFFLGADHQIASFNFFDAGQISALSYEELAQRFPPQILGTLGDDTLAGTDGNDLLQGGLGDDLLIGGKGDDTLEGGPGKDTLIGGRGNDLFVLRAGDGRDVIDAFDDSADRLDTLLFQDVSPDSIRNVRRQGDDLVFEYGPQQPYPGLGSQPDQVTLKGHFLGAEHQISQIAFNDGTRWSYEQLAAKLPIAVVGNDTDSRFTDANETIHGSAGDNAIYGMGGNDLLLGGLGDDLLDGGKGDDTLEGGPGKDTLIGGRGNDLFVLRAGDGRDVIDAFDDSADRLDTLLFQDVSPDSIRNVRRQGDDLVFEYGPQQPYPGLGSQPDQVTLKGHFLGAEHQISQIAFNDGTRWSGDELASRFAVTIAGKGGSYRFGDANDNVVGSAGNDTIYGMGGDDLLQGGAGNDLLDGGDGDDTLEGGLGRDTLAGGAGDDLYLHPRDSGDDLIRDNQGSNRLQLGEMSDSLWLSRRGDNLEISLPYAQGKDKVTVENWFRGAEHQLERISSADGKTLLAGQVDALVSAMAALGGDAPGASAMTQSLQQEPLHALVASSWH